MAYWFKVPGFTNIYASRNGEIKRVYKTVERLAKPYIKRSVKPPCYCVRIHNKEIKLARLIYLAFYGSIPKGFSVYHKDGYFWNNNIDNLAAVSKSELGKVTAWKSKAKRRVEKIDKEGNVVKIYRSSREAAKYENMSYQTILDRCHNKVKKPYALNGFSYRWEVEND